MQLLTHVYMHAEVVTGYHHAAKVLCITYLESIYSMQGVTLTRCRKINFQGPYQQHVCKCVHVCMSVYLVSSQTNM